MARYCNIGTAATLLPLLITLFITTKLSAAPLAGGGSECRGGTVGGCMETGGEEFLMDSETTRRLLSDGAKTNSIDYKGLQTPSVCDAKRSGSCLADKVGVKMNCNYYNKSCVKP